MTIGPLGIIPPPKLQFFIPGTTNLAVGGLLFAYAAGTTTKQATYSNDNQTPNTNPIVLDANGECVCFVDTTLKYDFTFSPFNDTDPPTNPYWTVGSMGYAEMIVGLAPLASPAFTGTPTAPTPSLGDSSSNIATTQFVQETVTNSFSGTPTVATAAPGTLTTQIASTAFVGAEIAKALSSAWFTSTTTFTVPYDADYLIKGWGGGAGGGAGTTSSSCGGGGGGGAYGEVIVALTAGTVLTITIGAGGTGSTNTSPGTSGGTTSVNSLLACGGGSGGNSSSSGGASGGSGGSASGAGAFTLPGENGVSGTIGQGLYVGGSGGSASFGGMGGVGSIANGMNGGFPGGGGSGGAAGVNGSLGFLGAVVIYWLAP